MGFDAASGAVAGGDPRRRSGTVRDTERPGSLGPHPRLPAQSSSDSAWGAPSRPSAAGGGCA
jgi:hypothetical protein